MFYVLQPKMKKIYFSNIKCQDAWWEIDKEKLRRKTSEKIHEEITKGKSCEKLIQATIATTFRA